jgi:hypothetical protein
MKRRQHPLIPSLAIAASASVLMLSASTVAAPNQCILQGRTPMPKDLSVYAHPSAGAPVARFSGAMSSVRAQSFPDQPGQRIAIVTGSSTKGFRISGYIDPSGLPMTTTQRLAVHNSNGTVWLAKGGRVEFVKSSQNTIDVRMRLNQPPMRDSFTATAQCSDLTLDPGMPASWAVPGNARGYVVKADRVQLYDDWRPDRSLGEALDLANGLLMWSTQRKGQFVRVEYHGPIVVQAWAKAADFRILPWGERQDRQAAAMSVPQPAQLRLGESVKTVQAPVRLPVRAAANPKAPVIGVVEAGATVYFLDLVMGWASVMPKDLDVMPYGENQFWVDGKKLGVTPK